MEGAERREYRVGRGDARRVADAVLLFQAARWQFWLPILLAVAAVAAVGYSAGGVGPAVGGIVLIAVVAPAVILLQRRRLATVLAARGFRPGAQIGSEFDGDRFTVTVEMGSSTHTLQDVAEVRVVRGIVLLRIRQARFVIALPSELVPAGSLRTLRAAP